MAIDLRALRMQANLSQDDLAHRLGVSRPHISRLETGAREIDLGLAERWAQECGFDIVVLKTGESLTSLISQLSQPDRLLLERLADLMPLETGYDVTLLALLDGWERAARARARKENVKGT